MLPEPDARTDAVAKDIVDAAVKVHRTFGPGLLEDHYRAALVAELRARGHRVFVNFPAQVKYGTLVLRKRYILDVVVDEAVVVELKIAREIHPRHKAQASSYLAATGYQLALLLNFQAPRMKDGICRIIRSRA